jgi:hypothetical protein
MAELRQTGRRAGRPARPRRGGLRRLRRRAGRRLDGRGGRGIDPRLVEQAAHRAVPGGDAPLRAGPASGRAAAALHALDAPATAAAWPRSCRPTSSACGRQRLVMTAPGDWRVLQAIKAVARRRAAAGDPRRPPLLLQRARVRGPRQGPQVAAHGVLLPRAAPAPRRADAGRRAGGRPVELRRRQPRGLRRRRPGRCRRAPLRARRHHARGDRAGRRRFASTPAGSTALPGR